MLLVSLTMVKFSYGGGGGSDRIKTQYKGFPRGMETYVSHQKIHRVKGKKRENTGRNLTKRSERERRERPEKGS